MSAIKASTRLSYAVVQRKPGESLGMSVYGPYRSFKKAEADAKAWEADGSICSVEPLMKRQEAKK